MKVYQVNIHIKGIRKQDSTTIYLTGSVCAAVYSPLKMNTILKSLSPQTTSILFSVLLEDELLSECFPHEQIPAKQSF